MRTLLFVVALVVVAVSATPAMKQAPQDGLQKLFSTLSEEETNKLCASINDKKHQMWSPLHCGPADEDHAAAGKEFLATHKVDAAQLNPVVLLPGLGGSSLDAQIDKNDTPSWYCIKHWDWFRIWFAIYEIAAQPCWMDNLDIDFDPSTGIYNNTPGVNIRPTDFGGIEGVAYLYYLLGNGLSITSYYADVIESLEAIGYEAGVNIFGAPYDWRLPATYAEKIGWMGQLQSLIENAYTSNGNLPVYVVTHSMGGPTGLYFLQSMTQTWRDTYIAGFIPVAGPWSGAPNALRAVLSGDNFGLSFLGIDIVSKTRLRDVAREAGGVISLVPNPDLNSTNAIFVYTDTKNYTLNDFPQLFIDAGTPISGQVYATTNQIIESLTAPNVPVYCAYGTGVPTEVAYDYGNSNFGEDPIIDESNLGDGTVPLYSLQECQIWSSKQSSPVQWKEFDLVGHGDILKDKEFLYWLQGIVTTHVESRV